MPEDELPDITPETPVISPAIPEKTYPKLWMDSMNISTPVPTQKKVISFSMKPYDGENDILQSPVKRNTIPDADFLSSLDPEFAQTMFLVVKMVDRYKDVDFRRGFTVVDGQIVYDPIPEPPVEPEPSAEG
jgi:hypothetical protein